MEGEGAEGKDRSRTDQSQPSSDPPGGKRRFGDLTWSPHQDWAISDQLSNEEGDGSMVYGWSPNPEVRQHDGNNKREN